MTASAIRIRNIDQSQSMCASRMRAVTAAGRDSPVRVVPAAYEAMCRAARNALVPGLVTAAISAVDVALWDLKAQVLDSPLARLLRQARWSVPVYGSGGFTSYDHDQLRTELRGWVHEQHISRVKIKIGAGWGQDEDGDLRRCPDRAGSAIGDAAELFVDANRRHTAKQAIRVARVPPSRGGCRGSRVRRGLLPPRVLRRGRRLPADRRDPPRRLHRVPAGGCRRRRLRAAAQHPYRAAVAPAGGVRPAAPAPRRVVRRSRFGWSGCCSTARSRPAPGR